MKVSPTMHLERPTDGAAIESRPHIADAPARMADDLIKSLSPVQRLLVVQEVVFLFFTPVDMSSVHPLSIKCVASSGPP